MNKTIAKNKKRTVRRNRIRAKVFGTAKKPRLSIFRSNKFIYAQLMDDENGKVIASANDMKVKKGDKKERAKAVGEEIAKEALAKKIDSIVFDRGGYIYTGRVQILAEAARAKGLKF